MVVNNSLRQVNNLLPLKRRVRYPLTKFRDRSILMERRVRYPLTKFGDRSILKRRKYYLVPTKIDNYRPKKNLPSLIYKKKSTPYRGNFENESLKLFFLFLFLFLFLSTYLIFKYFYVGSSTVNNSGIFLVNSGINKNDIFQFEKDINNMYLKKSKIINDLTVLQRYKYFSLNSNFILSSILEVLQKNSTNFKSINIVNGRELTIISDKLASNSFNKLKTDLFNLQIFKSINIKNDNSNGNQIKILGLLK